MAGSWHHVTDEATGELASDREIADMLEGGDWVEAIADMHGMICYLADRLALTRMPAVTSDEDFRRLRLAAIEEAKERYGDVVVRGVDLRDRGRWLT